MSIFAKKEFHGIWSDSKIQKLVDDKFKEQYRVKNVQKKKPTKITKAQWLKNNAKSLGVGVKKGWIELSEDVANPVNNVEKFVD